MIKRVLLLIIGFISLGLGVIGVFLPILPTVPFLLLSSFCFIKSSKKISIWFENTNIYKKHVRSFKENKAMTLKTKLSILIPVYVMLITLFFMKDILAMRIAIVVLLVVKTIVFIKIKTLKEA
ncbi:YbaN family protein [Clostridium sporogenes]|uniref:YbaN family protein n=1 Tax=Clostridium sporogenes TaxID=1509 RepID=UPI0022388D0D|nr:YbaN family protein [Clostridium sporogenes]MCW6061100.1 YbaN family protein [Clostridium sporogenes]MCW6069525.1 YbaN family protein [Clostridium sporogenes]